MSNFYKDKEGYWCVDRSFVSPFLAGWVEQDVQGDPNFCKWLLEGLEEVRHTGKPFSGTGNAHDVTIEPDGVTIVNMYAEPEEKMTLTLDEVEAFVREMKAAFEAGNARPVTVVGLPANHSYHILVDLSRLVFVGDKRIDVSSIDRAALFICDAWRSASQISLRALNKILAQTPEYGGIKLLFTNTDDTSTQDFYQSIQRHPPGRSETFFIKNGVITGTMGTYSEEDEDTIRYYLNGLLA